MRKYESLEENRLSQVICNYCGKELKVENGYLKEGCFCADYVFGYFSRQDGTRHRFDLCEKCYDNMIAKFQVPVEKTDEKELL